MSGTYPVQFQGQEFIRVGSYKKKLKEFPEKERALWRIFDNTPFEDLVAAEHVEADEVLRLLDYPAYFDLLKQPLPESKRPIQGMKFYLTRNRKMAMRGVIRIATLLMRNHLQRYILFDEHPTRCLYA